MAKEDAVGCEGLIAREPDRGPSAMRQACMELRTQQALPHFTVVSRLQPGSTVALQRGRGARGGCTAEAARDMKRPSTRPGVFPRASISAACVQPRALREARRHFERGWSQRDRGSAQQPRRDPSGRGGRARDRLPAAGDCPASDAEAHFNLARAYASAGRFADASVEERSLRRSLSPWRKRRSRRGCELLRLYRANQP
jgi:hypothetical protein